MIKFFGKIRYNLMEQNKTGKYLKYAIGEIALVMIGILLALQVNNWNEERKSNINETKLLNELYRDAKADSIFFESRNWYLEKHLNSVSNLNNLQLGENVDSISKLPFDNTSICDASLAYQSTVISNFKNRIDLLANDVIKSSLRKYNLAHHYLELHYQIKDRLFEKNCNDFEIKYAKYHIKKDTLTFGEYYKAIKFPENEKVINYLKNSVINSKERTENLITINTTLLKELRTVLKFIND